MAKKGTLESSKAIKGGGFGIQAGLVKLVDGRFKIVQYKKGDVPITPMMVHQLDVTKLNADLTPVDPDVTEQHDMLLCWGTKEKDENGLHKFRFHPASVKDGKDTDAKDLGAAIDTEGNTFCLPEDAEGEALPFADVDAVLFTTQLQKLGVKPEINDQAFAPNYNGLCIEIESVLPDVLCKELGVRYNAPKDPSQKPKAQWKIKKILNLDTWMAAVMGGKVSAGKAGAAAGAGAGSTGAGKPNGKDTSFDVSAYVLDRAKEVAGESKGKAMTKAELSKAIYKKVLKAGNLEPKHHKAVQDYAKSDAGIMELAGEDVLAPTMDDAGAVTGVEFGA